MHRSPSPLRIVFLLAMFVICSASAVWGAQSSVTMVTQAPKNQPLRIFTYPYDAKITGADPGGFATEWISQGPGSQITITCDNLEQLEVYGCWLSDLKIADAPGLYILKCYNNQLSNLDVSKLPELAILECQHNRLSSLISNANPKLEELNLSANLIADLNLGNLPALTLLHCEGNPLKSINLGGCPLLEELHVENCGLQNIDLSANNKLWWVLAFGNGLAGESMSNFIAKLPEAATTGMLYIVDTTAEIPESNVCTMADVRAAAQKGWATMDYAGGSGETQIGTFYPGCDYVPDISERTITLKTSRKAGEKIKLNISASNSISISGITQTTNLTGNNTFTLTDSEVVIKGDVTLFECVGCDVTSLTFGGEPIITYLDCRDNLIESLDFSGASQLKTLYTQKNHLTSINLQGCRSLLRFDCYENRLKGRAMTAMINSLPSSNAEPLLFVIDTKAADEQNVATVSQVDIATSKGWKVMDFCDGERWGMGVAYAGSEDTAPDEYFTLTRASKDIVSLNVAFSESSYTPTVEGGEIVAWNGTGLMIRMNEPTVTVYGDATLIQALFADLEGIDVSALPNLAELNVALNDLVSIDLSANKLLEAFSCEGNLIETLDFSSNSALRYVNCYGNKIQGAAMTAMMGSLPQLTASDFGTIIVHDATYTQNSNVCLKSDVALARSRYWVACELNSDDEPIPYDGVDPEPVKFKTSDGFLFQVNEADPTTVSLLPIVDGYQGEELVIPSTATNDATGKTYTVTTIAADAFYSAKASKITFPATVTEIHGRAFFNSSVASIVVDESNAVYVSVDGLLYTKDMATLCCFPPRHDFGDYKLPETVTRLGDYAFCGVFLKEFELPARVTSIGEGAFMGTKLKTMVVPSTVEELGGGAFQNCRSLTSIQFPEGMTLMPDHVLTFCNMLGSVNLPSSLTSIGEYAFNGTFVYGNTYGLIDEIVIPDKVVSIGTGAFQGDRGLTAVTLGKSVASIDLYAFAQCSGLKSVTSLNEVPPVCLQFDGNADEVVNTFAEVPDDCVLYVPAEAVNAYTASWGYKFKDIRGIDTGGVDNVADDDSSFAVSASHGMLSVSADGPVEVFDAAGAMVASAADGRILKAFTPGIYVVRSGSHIVKVAL